MKNIKSKGAKIPLTHKTTLENFHHRRPYVYCLASFTGAYKVQQEALVATVEGHKKSSQNHCQSAD